MRLGTPPPHNLVIFPSPETGQNTNTYTHTHTHTHIYISHFGMTFIPPTVLLETYFPALHSEFLGQNMQLCHLTPWLPTT